MSSKHLAIIPARKGSRSIRDKNIQKIGNRTLVDIVFEKALKSGVFDKIVISTDYDQHQLQLKEFTPVYKNLVRCEYQRRPAEISTDGALMKDVIKHVLDKVGKAHKWVWILQPTCPYSDIQDFKKIAKILEGHDKDPDKEIKSLISFKDCKEHPNRSYTIKSEGEYPEAFKLRWTDFKNKQDLPPKLIRSGNFYVFDRETFLKTGEFFNRCCYAYEVDRIKGLNIDDMEDLVLAKYYYNIGRVKI